jgi:hypothetical protein
MSVYLARDRQGRIKSAYWQYDFTITIKVKGRDSKRFHGSTVQKSKRAALRVEAKLKELAALGQLSSEMTMSEACWKYWEEVGAVQRSAKDNATIFEMLCTYFGKDTRLVDITPDKVAEAAATRARTPVRRAQGKQKDLCPALKSTGEIWMPSTSTVNRQIIVPMKRLLRRAKSLETSHRY